MEILCFSADTNLTIITIAVSAIGVLVAIIVFLAAWAQFKTITSKKEMDAIQKELEDIKSVLTYTYSEEFSKLKKNKSTAWPKVIKNFNDLMEYVKK